MKQQWHDEVVIILENTNLTNDNNLDVKAAQTQVRNTLPMLSKHATMTNTR